MRPCLTPLSGCIEGERQELVTQTHTHIHTSAGYNWSCFTHRNTGKGFKEVRVEWQFPLIVTASQNWAAPEICSTKVTFFFTAFHLFEGGVSLEEMGFYGIISVDAKNEIKVFKSLFMTINSLWLMKSSRPLCLDVTQNGSFRLFDPGQGTRLQPPWLLHPHLRHPPLLRVNAPFPQGWIHPSCPPTGLLHPHPSCHAYSPALTLLPH